MGFKGKRKVIAVGKYSKAITFPAGLEIGEESSIAANRIMVVDPRGKIDPKDLLEFLETHIEPHFWKWFEERKEKDKNERTRRNRT